MNGEYKRTGLYKTGVNSTSEEIDLKNSHNQKQLLIRINVLLGSDF